MSTPNTARITSLAGWTKFFHPTTGLFREPSASSNDHADNIVHLDIDLRFVDHESHAAADYIVNNVHLPNVHTLTLRGGEYVQDCDERMDCLAEVLGAISPIEVRW